MKLVREHINEGNKVILNRRTGTYIVKEKTNIFSVNRAVKLFLDSKNIEYSYEKARTTSSNYYEFSILDNLDIKIRVSDHTKAQGYYHSEHKEVNYNVYVFKGRILIDIEYNVDGINYTITDLKQDFDKDINEAKNIIDIDSRITLWSLNNINKLINEKGWLTYVNIQKEFNLPNTELTKIYLINKIGELRDEKEIKDKLYKINFKISPVGNLKTYIAKNGVYIDTLGNRDKSKWITRLPNDWDSQIKSIILNMTDENKIEYKNDMRKEAIDELDVKLKNIGK